MSKQISKDALKKVKQPSAHGGKSSGKEEGGGLKGVKPKADGLRMSQDPARSKPQAAFGQDMTEEVYGRTKLPYASPLFLILVGQKGSAKTTACATIPTPNDGCTFFLSFDRQTWPGLSKFYNNDVLGKIVVHDLSEPQPSRDYPGFDPNNPESAVIAIDEAAAILDMLEDGSYWTDVLELEEAPPSMGVENPEDIIVDNLILDHAQHYHKDIAPGRVTYENFNSDLMANFGMSDWGTRTKLSKLFISKAYRIPKHSFVLSGYSKKETWEKRGKQFVKEVTDSSWYGKWKKPAHAILEHIFEAEKLHGSTAAFRPKFKVVVKTTKSDVDALFPLGAEIDITSPIPEGKDRPKNRDNDGTIGYAQFWLESEDEEYRAIAGG